MDYANGADIVSPAFLGSEILATIFSLESFALDEELCIHPAVLDGVPEKLKASSVMEVQSSCRSPPAPYHGSK